LPAHEPPVSEVFRRDRFGQRARWHRRCALSDLQEAFVKNFVLAASLVTLTAAPLFAQTDRVSVSAAGGFAITPDTTSGDARGEVAVRVAPHLSVFGDLGQFHNVQPSVVQPSVDTTTAMLAASQGLDVIGTGRAPAWYGLGGVRYELPAERHFAPYVLGGVGFARLTPTASFTYSSGTLPDGSTPTAGDDVTSQLVTAGDFIAPAATTAFMMTVGGGVNIPVANRWAVDAGYRFSRIAADTPVNVNGVTFGLGYRF
jgi:opacity protein-like surface antigen